MIVHHYLDSIYRDMQIDESRDRKKQNNIAESYGEILSLSVNALLSQLHLTSQDVFVDLGSGLGKVVLQFFLQSDIKESYGIEIIPALHNLAVGLARRVQQDLPNSYEGGRKLEFLLGSFFELPLDAATIVLIGSVCFSPTMLLQLGKIIDNTPSIHTVLTLRPIVTLQRLRLKKIVRVECSWDSALCYIYNIKDLSILC